jgi:hypoxanthine-DNA glycosylase
MLKSNKHAPSQTAGIVPAVHPFSPIIDKSSKVLILGSFPSLKSFENNFYYAHSRNQFWLILSTIFKKPADTIEERIALLKVARIALWDVIGYCERKNSLDSNLKACQPNDIPKLLKEYPNIEAILFTGRKAEELYKRYFGKQLKYPTFLLPSPSPAYAVMRFESKLKVWRDILFKILPLEGDK